MLRASRWVQQLWVGCHSSCGWAVPGAQHGAAPHTPVAVRRVWNEGLNANEQIKAESFYDSTVEKYAQMPVEVLTLEQMLHFGRNALSDPNKVIRSAHFVQQELPKRLARRLLDLQLLPFLLVTNPHIRRVYNAYYHAFEVLRAHPPVTSLAENTAFCALLRRLVDEHGPMLGALAAGLREARGRALVGPALQLDTFLDAMLRSRISRRVIAEQHLHIVDTRPGYLGAIATTLDVADALDFAGQKAAQACSEAYGVCPELSISGSRAALLAYIPGHLDYMLHELLKNAMRATVERHRLSWNGRSSRGRMPPVQARICAGADMLTIRISDQGGGISEEDWGQVFSYGFTTIPGGTPGLGDGGAQPGAGSSSGSNGGSSSSSSRRLPGDVTSGPPPSPAAPGSPLSSGPPLGLGDLLSSAMDAPRAAYQLAGLGFGLPMSRLYARYFGGDLELHNLPGYGVDAFLTLPRLDGARWAEGDEDMDPAGARGAAVGLSAATDLHTQLQQPRQPRGLG